ncbi:MAG: NAD(P)-binding domain-containing protein [Liquorilactobacillus ghanensis]|uniref:NADPH-dependent F420 reductase n=1 Tax=Liquorilactobacillus ghanensis TaxID=399370 RepID=UPI0039E81BBD
MKIGFIGAGHVAQVLSELFIKVGHSVVLTNRHGLTRLRPIVEKLGPHAMAGNLEQAAQQELVILALPFKAIFELDPQPFADSAIIDATNYFPHRDGELSAVQTHQTASTELVAQHFPGARVVKAFNTLPVANLANLAQQSRSAAAAKKIALPLAGDAGVKLQAADLMQALGFLPYDVGSLADSQKFQADTNLFLFAGNHAELAQKLT